MEDAVAPTTATVLPRSFQSIPAGIAKGAFGSGTVRGGVEEEAPPNDFSPLVVRSASSPSSAGRTRFAMSLGGEDAGAATRSHPPPGASARAIPAGTPRAPMGLSRARWVCTRAPTRVMTWMSPERTRMARADPSAAHERRATRARDGSASGRGRGHSNVPRRRSKSSSSRKVRTTRPDAIASSAPRAEAARRGREASSSSAPMAREAAARTAVDTRLPAANAARPARRSARRDNGGGSSSAAFASSGASSRYRSGGGGGRGERGRRGWLAGDVRRERARARVLVG